MSEEMARKLYNAGVIVASMLFAAYFGEWKLVFLSLLFWNYVR